MHQMLQYMCMYIVCMRDVYHMYMYMYMYMCMCMSMWMCIIAVCACGMWHGMYTCTYNCDLACNVRTRRCGTVLCGLVTSESDDMCPDRQTACGLRYFHTHDHRN